MTLPVIALLGRKDEPTDAVEEYCRYLGSALELCGMELEIQRVDWDTRGWRDSLRALRQQSEGWSQAWVLAQYTALAWSARGFPYRFVRVLRTLHRAGTRVGVVFHDAEPFPGSRVIDRLRRQVQRQTMRLATKLADTTIFTVPPEKLSWLPAQPQNAVFIPVGPNLPFPKTQVIARSHEIPTVGVFSITGGKPGAWETKDIILAIREAAKRVGPMRLSVFGRHAELREADLHQGLQGLPVEVCVEGVAAGERIVNHLAACDALLFVRSGISTRRSSAIAGIAAGLPIVAYQNSETAPPITDAGVVLIDQSHPEEAGKELARILCDPVLRRELAARSRAAYDAHFAWPAIAEHYAAVLKRA